MDHNKLWKILKGMGIPDHLTCLLRKLYVGQQAKEPDMEEQTSSKLGKQYFKAIYCHLAYLTYMQRTSCQILDEAQAGTKIARRHINSIRYADSITLMAESKEELNSLLMKVKEESEKGWLKTQHSKNKDHGIQSHHFMANRWGNNGNSVRLYFGGLQNHFRW